MNLQYSPFSRRSRFVNLRHSEKSLVAVGGLAAVEVPTGSQPLLSVGDTDIAVAGDELIAVNHKSGQTSVFENITSRPRCAAELSPGRFTIFFEDGRTTYSIGDDGLIERCDEVVVPPFSIVASPLSTISVQTASVTLSRTYSSRDSHLDPTDVKRVSSTFIAAVDSASTSARTLSRFTSPVLVRSRVVDGDNRTVFVGPAILVNPLKSVDIAPVAVISTGSEFDKTASTTVDIDSFGLELKKWNHTAVPGLSVIVEVMNLTSLVDFDGTASCAIRRDSSGNGSLTVTAPLVTGNGEVSAAIKAMLGADDSQFVTFARIDNPFDGQTGNVALTPDKPFISSLSSVEISRRFKKQLELSATSDTQLVDSLAMPHTFLPTAVAKNGSAILFANPEVLFFKGYDPTCFAAAQSSTTGSATATATVRFNNGESVVVSSVYVTGGIPLKLSPVLSYPSRTATEMTVEIRIGEGQIFSHTFKLTALSGRDLSVFIADDLMPVNMSLYPAGSSQTEVSNPPRLSFPGVILTAGADDPYRPLDAAFESTGEIVAIAPVVCSPRGLEQRRNRFYIFGDEGIRLVTLNDRREIVNVVLTDRRSVKSGQCVATDSMGRIIALTAGGHLLALSGASAMTLDRCPGRAIAADNIHDELWIITDSPDSVTVRDMTKGDYYCRLIEDRIDRAVNNESGSSVIINNKISRVGAETAEVEIRVAAAMKIDGSRSTKTEMGLRMRTPAMFVFTLGASNSRAGSVTAIADDTSGNGRDGTLRSRIFSGKITRPVTLPVNFYPSETYTVTVEAFVNAGATFDGVKILYRR